MTLHLGNKPDQRETSLLRVLYYLLKQSQRTARVEPATAQMRIAPISQLELAILVYCRDTSSGRCQPMKMLVTSQGINRVCGPLAAFQALDHEGKKYAGGVIRALEKRANMSSVAKS